MALGQLLLISRGVGRGTHVLSANSSYLYVLPGMNFFTSASISLDHDCRSHTRAHRGRFPTAGVIPLLASKKPLFFRHQTSYARETGLGVLPQAAIPEGGIDPSPPTSGPAFRDARESADAALGETLRGATLEITWYPA